MERKCRNCGAVIEASDLKVCPYCDSELTFEAKADKSGAENTFEKTPDLSDISFSIYAPTTDETVAVNDVQTIKRYVERMASGEEEFIVLEASSLIYDIKYVQAMTDENYILFDIRKNDENYYKQCNFQECLSYFVDFYEGRFNPSFDEKERPAEKLFQINTKAFTEDRGYETSEQKAFEAIKTMCDYINNPYAGATNSDQRPIYLRFFSAWAENNYDRATPYVNGDLFKKAYALVSNRLGTDENPVYWMDDAAFKTGKKGVMLTDKRLFFVKKKEILEIPLKDIKSICLRKNHSSNWLLNGNKEYELFISRQIEAGAFFAYICSMARDLNDEGYKIKIDCEK